MLLKKRCVYVHRVWNGGMLCWMMFWIKLRTHNVSVLFSRTLYFFVVVFFLSFLLDDYFNLYLWKYTTCNMLFLEKRCQMFMSKYLQIYDSVPACLLGHDERTGSPLIRHRGTNSAVVLMRSERPNIIRVSDGMQLTIYSSTLSTGSRYFYFTWLFPLLATLCFHSITILRQIL